MSGFSHKFIQEANKAQSQASNPDMSVFVDASAGSGKTKLLIDRLLRLMLPRVNKDKIIPGADPANILCLTYTKAAAAEMQNRLRLKLAEWFGLSEQELSIELEKLELPANNVEIRAAARDLLRKVLESAVGVRIETIHAFCESLLRRFPLEAVIDPNFSLIDDPEKKSILRLGVEQTLASRPQAINILSPQKNFDDVIGMVGDLNKERDKIRFLEDFSLSPNVFEDFRHLYFRALGLEEEDLCWQAQWNHVPKEREWVQALREIIPVKEARSAMLDWLLKSPDQRNPEEWGAFFFTKEGKKRVSFPTKPEKKICPSFEHLVIEEAERLKKIAEKRQNIKLAEFGAAFLSLGWGGIRLLERKKYFSGQLDYDDLILRTRALLESVAAEWVRYKLDGGIDHLLLDEVQDNSLIQWKIIEALTAEFFVQRPEETGRQRTIFAVGDYKQSIYGFQGAKPDEFLNAREHYAQIIRHSDAGWAEQISLNVSFRTTQPVLDFVNELFQGKIANGVQNQEGAFPKHVPARAEKWGRVDVWPAMQVPPLEEAAPDQWEETSDTLLVKRLSHFLQEHFKGTSLPHLAYRDVLILVRKRSHLPPTLIRQLKQNGIAVVNCMGSKLIETPQLVDMLHLCKALLLPSDDFAFACFLTSPLGGLDDEALMALRLEGANGEMRPVLWEALKKRQAEHPAWQKAHDIFAGLLSRVDYDTPYQILSQALGIFGGRARMLARFGREAEEPLDQLLEAALEYESLHPPSLQGFLQWMEESEAEIKRQSGEGENAVRLMTVHGAKGLQAPLVILLCKKGRGPEADAFHWLNVSEDFTQNQHLPVGKWTGELPLNCQEEQIMRQIALEEEENRLLYVAATRPADWLIVAGWCNAQDQFEQPKWVADCMETLQTMRGKNGEYAIEEYSSGLRLPQNAEEFPSFSYAPTKQIPQFLREKPVSDEKQKISLPDWMGQSRGWQAIVPKKEDRLARPLRPSQSEDGALEDLPSATSPLLKAKDQNVSRKNLAARRGKTIHRLLEFLPSAAPEERYFMAQSWLDKNAPDWEEDEKENIARNMAALLEKPELAPVFTKGSRAEQPLTGIAAGHVVNGVVDRLNVTKNGIFLVDYKTGRKMIGEKSSAYRLQMALYVALLKEIYPDLPAYTYLVWTETLEVTAFSEDFLQDILQKWIERPEK